MKIDPQASPLDRIRGVRSMLLEMASKPWIVKEATESTVTHLMSSAAVHLGQSADLLEQQQRDAAA